VNFSAWGQADRRLYFEALVDHLRTNYAGRLTHEPMLIPVGDVLYEIHQRLTANPQPGPGGIVYTNVQQLFGDNTHLKPGVGRYVMAMTTLATLYQTNPTGLSTGLYNTITTYYPQYQHQFEELSDAMRALIQDAVWEVVRTHPYAGVLADRDHDGLDDAWEWTQYGGAGNCSPETDTDHDGMNAAEEFIAGTDPHDPASRLTLNIQMDPESLRLTWTRMEGRRYRIEWAPQATGSPFAPLAFDVDGPTNGYAVDTTAPSGYYRLAVEQQNNENIP
jgi:hypothetical protein